MGRGQQLARTIETALPPLGTRERAVKERAYLKSSLEHLGVTVPAIRRTVRAALRPLSDISRAEVLEAVRRLWRRPVHELRAAAVELLVMRRNRLVHADLALVEKLVREAATWALVDPLAIHVAGYLLERYPEELAPRIERWLGSPSFWLRRAALLVHLVPLREGRGDFPWFARSADALLDESEFFIRKAIGWVLRDTSRKRPRLVLEFLTPRIARASGVTVREAVKYLTAAQRAKLATRRLVAG